MSESCESLEAARSLFPRCPAPSFSRCLFASATKYRLLLVRAIGSVSLPVSAHDTAGTDMIHVHVSTISFRMSCRPSDPGHSRNVSIAADRSTGVIQRTAYSTGLTFGWSESGKLFNFSFMRLQILSLASDLIRKPFFVIAHVCHLLGSVRFS